MNKRRSGSVWQGGLAFQKADYGHLHVGHPVMGVVLNVYRADDHLNEMGTSYQDGRSPYCTAKVRILNSGTDTPMILPTVLVLPRGSSGHDDFSEELPKGTTATLDGRTFSTGYEDIPPQQLNGDFCVVQFIGGSVHHPVMTSWFPHPGNRKDAATNGTAPGAEVNGRRIAKRFQGTRFAVTSEGTVFLDTSKANHTLDTTRSNRNETPKGGDVKVTVKNDRELEVNFNKPVFDANEPDFLWERQEVQAGGNRSEESTRLLMDKDFIRAVAGQVVQMAAAQNIFFGQETATENFVLGQQLKALLITILQALLSHQHPIPPLLVDNAIPLVGALPVVANASASLPPPLPAQPTDVTMPSASDDWQSALNDVMAETILSDWIFGQKSPP